jgi:hypothetical protein
MVAMTINDVLLTMTVCLFFIGIVSLGAGVFILISRVLNEDLRTIANETTQLAKKGISEEITGLVGNASVLIDSMNQLIKTSTGIGLALVIIGLSLILVAYYLLQQIF